MSSNNVYDGATTSPEDEFDEMFGAVLDNVSDLFVVKGETTTTTEDERGGGGGGREGSESLAALENDNDILTVLSVERRSKELRSTTKDLIDQAREQLRTISLDYKTALTNSQRSSNLPSQTDHQRVLENMFQGTLNTMKGNSELDQQVMELQGELQRLNRELKEEERDAVQVGGLNSDVLKLKLYRDMGFTPLADKEGKFTKMIVRSAHSQEARTVELNPNVNDFQWCNFLWGIVDGRVPPGTTSA